MAAGSSTLLRAAKIAWAAPCSLVGLTLAAPVLLLGGRARRSAGAVEVTFRPSEAGCGRLARALPFRAIALGHVVIAVTGRELDGLRAHELVHVRQYEHWGAAFFPAYAASALWQLLRGRNPYWDNHFEVQARLQAQERNPAKTSQRFGSKKLR